MRERLARVAKYWPVMLFVTWHEGTLTVFAAWGAQTQALLAWIASGAVLGPLAGRVLHRAGVPGPRDGETADGGPLAADETPAALTAADRYSDPLPGAYSLALRFPHEVGTADGGRLPCGCPRCTGPRTIVPADHQAGAPSCSCRMCEWGRSHEQDTPGT